MFTFPKLCGKNRATQTLLEIGFQFPKYSFSFVVIAKPVNLCSTPLRKLLNSELINDDFGKWLVLSIALKKIFFNNPLGLVFPQNLLLYRNHFTK